MLACLKALRDGDVLVIWKLDRLSRSLKALIETVHDLTSRDIGLKVLAGHGAAIDTTSPSGKLIFNIFSALSEYERDLIVERTRSGLMAARARARGPSSSNASRRCSTAPLNDPFRTLTDGCGFFDSRRS